MRPEDQRRIIVALDDRSVVVPSEPRRIMVQGSANHPPSRRLTVPADDRRLVLRPEPRRIVLDDLGRLSLVA